jgi:hypothetical protein
MYREDEVQLHAFLKLALDCLEMYGFQYKNI